MNRMRRAVTKRRWKSKNKNLYDSCTYVKQIPPQSIVKTLSIIHESTDQLSPYIWCTHN